jgi:hypothetical protein
MKFVRSFMFVSLTVAARSLEVYTDEQVEQDDENLSELVTVVKNADKRVRARNFRSLMSMKSTF